MGKRSKAKESDDLGDFILKWTDPDDLEAQLRQVIAYARSEGSYPKDRYVQAIYKIYKPHLDAAAARQGAIVTVPEATNDQLIAELERRGAVNGKHVIDARIADFSMKHTLRCQPDLFNCSIHKAVERLYLDNGGVFPWHAPHQYEVDFREDGELQFNPIHGKK